MISRVGRGGENGHRDTRMNVLGGGGVRGCLEGLVEVFGGRGWWWQVVKGGGGGGGERKGEDRGEGRINRLPDEDDDLISLEKSVHVPMRHWVNYQLDDTEPDPWNEWNEFAGQLTAHALILY